MSKQAWLWLVVGVALLAGLYVALRSADDGATPPNRTTSPTFTLNIGPFDPAASFPTFKAMQGDRVTFRIHSDRRGQVNVHGYEKQVAVAPGQESSLTLTVQEAGTFPLHLHELADPSAPQSTVMHRHLAVLEVQPR